MTLLFWTRWLFSTVNKICNTALWKWKHPFVELEFEFSAPRRAPNKLVKMLFTVCQHAFVFSPKKRCAKHKTMSVSSPLLLIGTTAARHISDNLIKTKASQISHQWSGVSLIIIFIFTSFFVFFLIHWIFTHSWFFHDYCPVRKHKVSFFFIRSGLPFCYGVVQWFELNHVLDLYLHKKQIAVWSGLKLGQKH